MSRFIRKLNIKNIGAVYTSDYIRNIRKGKQVPQARVKQRLQLQPEQLHTEVRIALYDAASGTWTQLATRKESVRTEYLTSSENLTSSFARTPNYSFKFLRILNIVENWALSPQFDTFVCVLSPPPLVWIIASSDLNWWVVWTCALRDPATSSNRKQCYPTRIYSRSCVVAVSFKKKLTFS